MKKLLSLALVLLFVLSLAACSPAAPGAADKTPGASGGKDGNAVELVVWGHQEESWNASYRAIADAFMAENPDIRIKYEFFPYDDFESKVQTSLISKSGGADVYEIWGGWGVDYASTGALAAMPDAMADEIRHDAYPCTYGALEYGGKLYGMPMEFNIECGGLLVNNKLLAANNLAVPATWDELIAEAKKAVVTENGVMTTKGFDFVGWDGVPYLFTSMILSQGGNYLNDDGSFNFTSAEAKRAFSALADLVLKDGVTDLTGLTEQNLEGYQQLFADQAVFVPRGPWSIAEGISTFGLTYDKEFSYVPMPWYGEKAAFAAETGWAFAVSASSAKQEAAFRFLDYFFSDSVIMRNNVACGQIPAKKSVAQSAEYLEQFPYAEPLVGILDQAQFIGYFNTDQFKEIINGVFLDYCTGGIYASVDDAMASLETKLSEM
ncbi:MAG TPA: extracellular solute-binding protein [Feifaniaceae bacterium]|nr:extracellular solute-binding protein [Feifaniaceae bacterium]